MRERERGRAGWMGELGEEERKGQGWMGKWGEGERRQGSMDVGVG